MPKGTCKRRAKLGLEPDSWLFLPKPPSDLSSQGSPAPVHPLPPASILHQKKANCGQRQLPGVPHSLTSPSSRPLHLEARTVGSSNWCPRGLALGPERGAGHLSPSWGWSGAGPAPVVTAAEPPAPRESAAPDPKPEMQVSLPLPIPCSAQAKANKAGRGSASALRGPPPQGRRETTQDPGLSQHPAVPAQTARVRLWFCFQWCHFLAVQKHGQASPDSLSPDSLPGTEPRYHTKLTGLSSCSSRGPVPKKHLIKRELFLV